MTTATDAAAAAAEIFDLIGTIKELTARKEELQAVISNAIDLGELDDALMADDRGYQLGSIRCCPVRRSTWEFMPETKNAIKALQEQAKVEGLATEKVSVSYRFTAIEADS